jgi:hypothetical protein
MHAHTKTKTNKNMEQNIDDENGMYTDNCSKRISIMVFNATFNNISVIVAFIKFKK